MLISAVESCVSDINIWGVKCDKVVDFPKSGHIFNAYRDNSEHIKSMIESF